ncbi:MAG: hypothetical protein HOH20_01155 [Rhodospirillaceae bacterium]|nr:hypothetical protein [Rhodospirillaceae bacterium]MBT6088161.1 hypothetical protein [Rhodospirillaceae bacterium]
MSFVLRGVMLINRQAWTFSPLPALLFTAFGFVSQPASADSVPSLSADITAELQYENGVGPDSAAPQSDFLFATIEVGLSAALSENFGIESVILMEAVDDPPAGENLVLEKQGVFAEEVMLAYHGDTWSMHAGKFNTAFGTGWDLGAGIWGVDFAEDYEVTEKLGLAATRTFASETSGQHTLYGSVYRADRSFLSGSLIEDRGRLRLADGGTTNTKDFESYTVSLTGEDILGMGGLGYHLAYRSHAHGDADLNAVREDGFAASLFGVVPIGGLEIEAMTEGAYINNAEGSFDDISYLTLGGTAYFADSWNAALSVTFRTTHVEGGADTKDHRFQATTGYAWDSGISLDFGYRYSREDGTSDHVLGFLMAYAFSI